MRQDRPSTSAGSALLSGTRFGSVRVRSLPLEGSAVFILWSLKNSMSTPRTEEGWLAAIAASHPDVGGDHATCVKLTAGRDRWRRRQQCVCGMRRDPKRGDAFCSNLCARTRVVTPVKQRALKAAPPAVRAKPGRPTTRIRCAWASCGAIFKPIRRRNTRPPQRFCSSACAARWVLSQRTHAQLQEQGRRAGAVNKMRSNWRVADKFRHITGMDERVRLAYKAGYQAGYQALCRLITAAQKTATVCQ